MSQQTTERAEPGRATDEWPAKHATEHEVREVAGILSKAYTTEKQHLLDDPPMDSVIRHLLSQNTNDRNRDAAFAALKARFPTWDEAADAPLEEIHACVHPANHSYTKAQRIRQILQDIRAQFGSAILDVLRDWPTERVQEFLRAMEGIGPKTAACVLMFCLKRPVMPVDTHVHRVAQRLGWIGPRVSKDAAHEALQALVPPELIYTIHTRFWEHGHHVCRPANPKCELCPVYSYCIYPGKKVVG